MAKVLVYYPFKMNAWFGKAVTFTLNSQKYQNSVFASKIEARLKRSWPFKA